MPSSPVPESWPPENPPPRRRLQLRVSPVLLLLAVWLWFLVGPLVSIAVLAVAVTREPVRNMLLFVFTCVSTYFVQGPWYALTLMTILLTHEMGHYTASRLHRVHASLPFFIPMPFSILGTLGAVIVSRSPFPTRRELFDIGVAGPLAGFVIALPAWLVGLTLSTVEPRSALTPGPNGVSLEFGDSLLTWVTAKLVFPHMPDDGVIMAHPIAIAGWVGLFVTALNLIPAGSLDGGHISYALWWRHHRRLSFLTALALVAFGIVPALTLTPAQPWMLGPIRLPINGPDIRWVWVFWAGLVVVFGLRHPPPMYPHVPITRNRLWVAALALCIFVGTFVPNPLQISMDIQGAPSHESESQRDPARKRQEVPEQHRDPGRGRTLDVRATPAACISLRERPA